MTKTDKNKIFSGRRKTSVSRVRFSKGSGKIEVNSKDIKDYFVSAIQQSTVKEPLVLTENLSKYDIKIDVRGGGLYSQAGAAKLGIARGLTGQNDELRNVLKKAGLLTCDPRQKERKKYGQKKARKRFQFSKR